MGLCGVMAWDRIQPIWREIEGTKTDLGLRRMLGMHWPKNQSNLKVMFYNIYWVEVKDLMTLVQKVEFTESGGATFVTSECGLSPSLQLMTRASEEMACLDQEGRRRNNTARMLTHSNTKKAEKAPCLPPMQWDETVILLTTYTLFLKILLFGTQNAHCRASTWCVAS